MTIPRFRAVTRRTVISQSAASAVISFFLPKRVIGQTPTPEPPASRYVARVRSDEWAGLETASATPVADAELAGPNLLDALREGGFVIYFRHASTDFSEDDTDLSDLSNCATQRNLAEDGREQSRQIGEAIAALEIPIGDVLSSELCRTRETAELAFGRVILEPELSSFGTAESDEEVEDRAEALRRMLGTPPERGTNTVLVGHLFNIQRAVGLSLAEGEAGIFLPLGTEATPASTPGSA